MHKYNKIFVMICILIAVFGILTACSENKTNQKQKNKIENISVFDEAFYNGVKSVALVGTDMIIEDAKVIDEIKKNLLSVKTSKSNEDISDYYGTTILVFTYDDGASKTVSMTSELILDLGVTYNLETDICSLIRKKFVDK